VCFIIAGNRRKKREEDEAIKKENQRIISMTSQREKNGDKKIFSRRLV
jgi:hypothetical protein